MARDDRTSGSVGVKSPLHSLRGFECKGQQHRSDPDYIPRLALLDLAAFGPSSSASLWAFMECSCGRGMSVGRKVMEFCGSIVRALWHDVSPGILDATYSPQLPRLCSVRTLDDVLRLGCFCGPSRGRSAGFLPVLQRGFVLRNAAFRNLHGGQDDDTTTCRH
jgi:hypothetical protein